LRSSTISACRQSTTAPTPSFEAGWLGAASMVLNRPFTTSCASASTIDCFVIFEASYSCGSSCSSSAQDWRIFATMEMA